MKTFNVFQSPDTCSVVVRIFAVVAPVFLLFTHLIHPRPMLSITFSSYDGNSSLRIITALKFFQFPDVFALCDLHDFKNVAYCRLTENDATIAPVDRNSLKQSWNFFDEPH
jgi:hypothetical protein